MDKSSPSPNGENGRDQQGRFAKGNGGGPGNPFAKQIAELRKTLLESVTPADMREVVKGMVKEAKEGNIAAVRELLSRTLGPPVSEDLLERLEALEQKLQETRQ